MMPVSHRIAAAVLVSTVSVSSAAGQCFAGGDILLYSPNIPTGPTTTERGVIRLDPVDLSTSVLYSTGSPAFSPRIAYDPFRSAAILKPNNINELWLVDQNGAQSSVALGLPFVNRFAPSGDGKIYITSGGSGSLIGYVDSAGVTQQLFESDGITQATVDSAGLINSLYFHPPSNSLYYDKNENFGGGGDEDFIVQLMLSSDGTRVIATDGVQVNEAPGNLDVVTNITAGRDANEVYYHLDVNNNGQFARASVINTSTLAKTNYFQSGYFGAAAANVSVYSPLADTAVVFSGFSGGTDFREFSFGDVDLLGVGPITPVDFVVEDMAVVPGLCRADTNRDCMLTPADFTAWVIAFNAQSALCDQNADGNCDPADFTAWVLNYNAGC